MTEDDDILTRDEDGNEAAPLIVGLPLASGTAAGGVMQGGSGMNLAAISPAPLVGDPDDGGGDNLADRVESIIADDGRFRAFASGLTFLVDEAGIVSLSGSVPSADMKRSLLASIHAVPGVAGVQENLTVAE